MTPAALRTTALASLRTLIATRAASDAARKSLQALDPDGFDMWRAIPPAIEDALVGLAGSLTAINEKHAACDTLNRLRSDFPSPRADLRDSITRISDRAGCPR